MKNGRHRRRRPDRRLLRAGAAQGRISRARFSASVPRAASSEAVERGAIDRGATLEEAAGACDLLFLSQPISGILETLRKLDPLVRPDALVTDAGSTKQAIVDEAKRSSAALRVSSAGIPWRARNCAARRRPMPTCFADGPGYSPPTSITRSGNGSPPSARAKSSSTRASTIAWWPGVPILPQLASTALAAVLARPRAGRRERSRTRLLDSTRLAMSSFDLWRDILETNKREVSRGARRIYRKAQGAPR